MTPNDQPTSPRPAAGRSTPGADRQLHALLLRVRSRARLLLMARGAAWVLGAAIVALIAGGLLDYVLRSPWWLRTLGLASALGVLVWAIGRVILPALLFRPSLTEIALRVERVDAAERAGLRDRLAPAIDLSLAGTGESLSGRVIAEAARRASALGAGDVLSPARTLRVVAGCAICVLIGLGLASARPQLAAIGAARMLWPWGGAEWPKRTQVADATGVRVHPLGSALALRGGLVKSDRDPGDARVTAAYRLVVDGNAGPTRRVVLTPQNRTIELEVEGDGESGAGRRLVDVPLFERLIEPTGLRPETPGQGSAAFGRIEIEYALISEDDETERSRIELVEPPSIVGASLIAVPPSYASELAPASAPLDLGPGTDERAAPPAMLAGTEMQLTLRLNKPVPGPPTGTPEAGDEHASRVGWVSRSLGNDAAKLFDGVPHGSGETSIDVRDDTWTIRWTLREATRMLVRPVDEHGISSGEDAGYRFEAIKDNPPTASIVTPIEDQAVLSTAIVELVGEGRDDVGLASLALEHLVARRPAGSEGRQPEPAEEYRGVEGSGVIADEQPGVQGAKAQARTLRVAGRLDLSTLTLSTGDEVWITAVASDAFELEGRRHEPVRSSVRKLRILSREELIEQIWSDLGQARRAALRLDNEQGENAELARTPGEEASRRAERAQAGLTERLSRQSESLQRIADRIEQNALTDQTLRETVGQARAAMQEAGSRSVAATQSLGEQAQARSQDPEDPKAGEQAGEQAQKAQQDVRDELDRLIDLLDRGEDTFAAKRSLERLLKQQRELIERTREAGRETAGKSASDLSEGERDRMEALSKDQRAAAEQLRESVRKMNEREQKLSQTDPAAAQAMAEAARRAERQQVAQKMDQAAQQVQQNRTGAAEQQQQQAARSIEQMLQDIDQAQSSRDEVLRRALASLMETLDGLIATQEQNLNDLERAIPTGELAGLDGAMLQLHRGTLGAVDLAASGPRELRALVDVIASAAEAQTEAITALRASPRDGPGARAAEQQSLERLIEARDKAQKLQEEAEERQNERERTELRKKYLEALETQLGIKSGAEGLTQEPASRRARAAARALGEEQATLRDAMRDLRESTREIATAKTFDFAHRRLDALMESAASRLGEGAADDGVVRSQTSAARLLKSLADALDQSRKKNKPFRQGEGGGGGQGSGRTPLVPPAAEVKLLRELQIEAAESTRSAGEDPDARADETDRAKALQKDIAEQARDLLRRLMEEAGAGEAPAVDAPAEQSATEPKGARG